MSNLKKWQILQSELVINHQWCKIRKDQVRLDNGMIIDDFFINMRPDIAYIFPITADQKVVFVRQYRHGVQQILLELPAGNFDATQENSLEAARRELQEETGYVAKNMIKLCELYGDPVKETNTLHVFLGENVEKTAEIALDITENIEVVLIPLDQVKAKICNNEIMVCGSISAIFFALNYLGL